LVWEGPLSAPRPGTLTWAKLYLTVARGVFPWWEIGLYLIPFPPLRWLIKKLVDVQYKKCYRNLIRFLSSMEGAEVIK